MYKYNNQCDGESRDAEKLQHQIDTIHHLIKGYEHELQNVERQKFNATMSGIPSPGIQARYTMLISSLNMKIRNSSNKKLDLERKLRELLAFDSASSEYFSEVESSETLLTKGLQALGQDVNGNVGIGNWNGNSFLLGNQHWIKEVNKKWDQYQNEKTANLDEESKQILAKAEEDYNAGLIDKSTWTSIKSGIISSGAGFIKELASTKITDLGTSKKLHIALILYFCLLEMIRSTLPSSSAACF